MADKIGTPTMAGFKSSMINYGIGLGGGILYALVSGFTGNSLIGSLISAGLVGSTIKGTRGEILATVLGFQTIVQGAQQQQSAPAQETM